MNIKISLVRVAVAIQKKHIFTARGAVLKWIGRMVSNDGNGNCNF